MAHNSFRNFRSIRLIAVLFVLVLLAIALPGFFKTRVSNPAAGTMSGGYIQVATVGANVRTYTDNTLFRKTTYFYRVRAANSGGKSGYSNVASVKTK